MNDMLNYLHDDEYLPVDEKKYEHVRLCVPNLKDIGLTNMKLGKTLTIIRRQEISETQL